MVEAAAPDVVVNNAVVRYFGAVENFVPEHWDEALAVNLSAPFHVIRLSLPGMKAKGWGRIINMASIYAHFATVNRIDYITTKTALPGLTRAVALEVARTGITCNAIRRDGADACHRLAAAPGHAARRHQLRGSRSAFSQHPSTLAPVRQRRQRRRADRLPLRAA